MRRFTVLTGPATLLPAKNIDIGIILPVNHLVRSRNDRGGAAFHIYRFAPDGSLLKHGPFHRPDGLVAPIIIAGENFGCGSWREHASWALDDFGVRVIISPRFAEIFAGEAFKNGLLLIELPQSAIDSLIAGGTEHITVDLAAQTVSTPDWGSILFEIDPLRKSCLLGGLDEIAPVQRLTGKIVAFERAHEKRSGWVRPKLRQ